VLHLGTETLFSFAASFAKIFTGRAGNSSDASHASYDPRQVPKLGSQYDNPVLLNPLFPWKTLNHMQYSLGQGNRMVLSAKPVSTSPRSARNCSRETKIPPGSSDGKIWPTLLPPLTFACLNVNSPGSKNKIFKNKNICYSKS